MEKTLLDANQAAALLGVQASTIRHWVFREKIPCLRVGRKLRFRPSDIEKIQKDGMELDR